MTTRTNNTKDTTLVKKALAKVFGYKNVSVVRDRGTAYGWIRCSVTLLERPKGCYCADRDRIKAEVESWLYNEHTNCTICTEHRYEQGRIVEDITLKAGANIGHYYADDGYNTQRPQISCDAHYTNQDRY